MTNPDGHTQESSTQFDLGREILRKDELRRALARSSPTGSGRWIPWILMVAVVLPIPFGSFLSEQAMGALMWMIIVALICLVAVLCSSLMVLEEKVYALTELLEKHWR